MKANDAAKHEAKVNGGEASLWASVAALLCKIALRLLPCPVTLLPLCAEPVPVTKRKIVEPRGGFMLQNVTAETITPIPYDIIKEGLKT